MGFVKGPTRDGDKEKSKHVSHAGRGAVSGTVLLLALAKRCNAPPPTLRLDVIQSEKAFLLPERWDESSCFLAASITESS